MYVVVQKRHLAWFLAVAVLIAAQVIWWNLLFLQMTEKLAHYGALNARQAVHQKWMFVSESGFFLLITGFGLFLLYRAFKQEQRTRLAEKNFIEVWSHESRTPLTALKLRIDSVKEQLGEFPGLQTELESAGKEIRRLSSLFEKVLLLNRWERGAWSHEPVYLSSIIDDTLHRFAPLIQERKIRIAVDCPEEIAVKGDSYALQTSLQSLIENAIYYNSSPEKTISIEVKEVGNKTILRVSDNGKGIREEDRDLIFQRFYRGKQTSSVPGTGLGLYISRIIAIAHGGNLDLVPSSKGTCFEMTLPRGLSQNG